MSGRGNRKRGRPPKTPNERTRKFNYQFLKKPKYLSRSIQSQISTPSISRPTSPEEYESIKSNRQINTKTYRGRGRKSVNATISIANRKGYESEYHYGSDFADSSEKSDADDDLLLMTCSEDDSLDIRNESESEYSECSFNQAAVGKLRPPSPDPIWLQERNYPSLELPESSHDLLIDESLALKALCIYEVLRRFRHLVRLSPFRFEDFCAALVCDDQSALLTDVHIMLLKAILREEDAHGTHFGPLDQKDTVNISLYLIDSITWPEVLRNYVESDMLFDRNVLHILRAGEYPYSGIDGRLAVLQFLTDQFLTTNGVRDVMLQEGPIHYDDHCRICHRLGDLLCCETCPAVYHLECVDPPLQDVPTEDWQCNLCKSHKVAGVVDCVLQQEKQGVLIRHDLLGLDRHGRRFWFIARRIFVEDNIGENVWYYSTSSKFEELLSLIDKEDLEAGLFLQLCDKREEILRQIKITEILTAEYKNTKKSYIDFENESTSCFLNTIERVFNYDKTVKKCIETKNVTRKSVDQVKDDNLYFKLGMENGFKSYANQYNINPIALNKPQRNEERDKRRHLSHKFSLTTASEFKWIGFSMGTTENIITTIRQTLINFEQAIAMPFKNPNWISIQKLWNSAVLNSSNPNEFATVLLIFEASLKNVLFANVWHEHLGHTTFKRITSTEREERKKIEKREKRERDDEEERNRLAFNYIKYSLGLKHQVWKQKGEEYRVHGQWGWMWLSSSRRCVKRRSSLSNQNMLPANVNVCVSKNGDVNEIVSVNIRTKQFLTQCAKAAEMGLNLKYLQKFEDIKIFDLSKGGNAFDVVDVGKSFILPGRPLYPFVAKKTVLDNMLSKRTQLKAIEEQLVNENGESQKIISIDSKVNKSAKENFLEKRLMRLVDKQKSQSSSHFVNISLVNLLAKKIQSVRLQFSQLNRFAKSYRCYTKECNTNSNAVSQITQNTCYSPLCLQKARAKKELLLLLRKAHTAGNGSKETVAAILGAVKKPSILEQKLMEGKKDSIISLEETLDSRSIEGIPFNVLQDWEHAVSLAIKLDKDSINKCFVISDHKCLDNNQKNKRSSKIDLYRKEEANENEDEFIENLDVCSNIEVESSDTFAIENLLMAEEADEECPLLKKNKKIYKSRTKLYMVGKDVQAESKDFPQTKQNRRFPLNSKISKREYVAKIDIEYFPNGKQRIYSTDSTKGKIYLLSDISKINHSEVNTSQNGSYISKFPLISNFLTHKLRRSLLILPQHELRKLGRSGGKVPASGFHQLAKNNALVWKYPCSRPLFKTCWSYRTSAAASLATIALQLRILWSCLRWDDMFSKPPSLDGKHQVTTETEIVTLELLELKNFGRFGERTQYLRKKVVVPLEQPKTIREVTSIRSGLRKRKRAESPQPTEPQISEEWVEEEKLELWEIKHIGERFEKCKIAATRSASLRLNEHNCSPSTTSTIHTNSKTIVKNSDEMKGKMDQQLKPPKSIQQQKKNMDSKTSQSKTIIGNRRVIVKNPDGTTRIIHQTITAPSPKSNAILTTLTTSSSSPTVTTSSSISIQHQVSQSSQQHKVQIIRGLDGKVSVRGLNPGQQLIQMPDGKLHVLSTTQAANSKNKLPVKQVTQASPPIIKQIMVKQVPKITSASQHKFPSVASTVKQVAKVLPQSGQKLVPISNKFLVSSSSATTTMNTTQNLQHLVMQTGQKVLAEQSLPDQKVVLTGQKVTPASPSIQSRSSPAIQCIQQEYQQVAVSQLTGQPNQTAQKVIQQIVNTSNVQQQIMVGGQKIVLSPGQTIVTQRALPQTQQIVSQQIISQPSQETNLFVAANQVAQLNTQQFEQRHEYMQEKSKSLHFVTKHENQGRTIESNSPMEQEMPTPNSQKIIVQNSTLAQQLAQGKLQVAVINEQQVIIKPLGNNQAQIVAHIKTQSDGNSHIVTNTSTEESFVKPHKIIVQPVYTQTQKHPCKIFQQSQQQKLNRTPKEQTNTTAIQGALHSPQNSRSIEENLLQGQPPGTVIKCVTAQVIQTEQGPRIVLQGLVGNDFTQQQLTLVQQQVKQQLLKAQESSGKQGVLGPTKIYLAVQPSNVNSQPPPLTPVIHSMQQQATHSVKLSSEKRKPVIPQEINSGFQSQLNCPTFTPTENKSSQEPKSYISCPGVVKTAFEETPLNSNKVQTKFIYIEENMKKKSLNLGFRSKKSKFLSRLFASNQNKKQSSHCNVQNALKDHDKNNRLSMQIGGCLLNSANLQRHKDALKKNILKKRTILEQKIKEEILKEMTGEVLRTESKSVYYRDSIRKEKKLIKGKNNTESSKAQQCRSKKGIKKKEKLYCTCRTPYDDTKFYVGCDLCSNWFHGECVNISEEDSKMLSEFICGDCRRARETQELYCSCRQPYDESQFYICCDKCQDWFHGRCVGIAQSEAEFIDEYVCPDCQRNQSVNDTKNITKGDKEALKGLIKEIQTHKSAWPFMEPVDPKDAPDYYKVIKDPIDLQKIEAKLNMNEYRQLSEFIADITKIFDNCRYYNSKESSFYKCAENLEGYFVQKIKNYRKNFIHGNHI